MSAIDHLRKSGQPAFTSWMRGNADFELYTLICRTGKSLPVDASMSLAWPRDGATNRHHIETLERLCRVVVDDDHGVKSYCGAVYADRGALMNHIRQHHDIDTQTRNKKDAKANSVKNKGGKTSKDDQPSIKGYYRRFIESIRAVDPNYFQAMESLRSTMHEDPATLQAMTPAGRMPSRIIAAPPQRPAIDPQADVDKAEPQMPSRTKLAANARKPKTVKKAHAGAKGNHTWTRQHPDEEDDDEEFFKREVDSDIEEVGANTVAVREPNKKDIWARFSHPEEFAHILVETKLGTQFVGDALSQTEAIYPLLPLRGRLPDDDFDEHHVFGDGKSAVDFVPERRLMLAITEIMELPYGEFKACDVCEKSAKKGGKRAKVSRCKMNSTKCRGFEQFSSMTFNVEFSEAEYIKYRQQTLAKAQKRA